MVKKLTLKEAKELALKRSNSGENRVPKITITRKTKPKKVVKPKSKPKLKVKNENTVIEEKKKVIYDPDEGKTHDKEVISNDFDIKMDEKITFFDSELSYELTGYRPITMYKGLDFDIEPFIKVRAAYERSGKYTTFPKGGQKYREFWMREKNRCINGMTIGRFRLTGDHYYFMNYYRILNVMGVESAAKGRTVAFPTFISEQYKWFHYVEIAEKLGFDCAALKPRGVGWSEIAASLGVRVYTTVRNSLCRYAATADNFLADVLGKCWDQMDFLNTETDGGFKHLRLVKSSSMERRASLRDVYGNESGFKSEIQGINVDQSRKLRGGRVERLFFEESGSNAKLTTTYNQSEALVVLGGKRIGTRFVWGTGGDSGPQLAGLSEMFYNPKAFTILPYKHNHNLKHETVYTAFFISAYDICFEFCDKRGVCNRAEAINYYNIKRAEKALEGKSKNLIEYKSEYCFYPEEALSREGENRFDADLITEQIANIELHHTVAPPTKGTITFPKTDLGEIDFNSNPIFTTERDGKVNISEMPIKSDEGGTYENLYVAGIDSIDSDNDTSSGQTDVSDFCIVIKRRQLGMKMPAYVAYYKYRPRDVRNAYKTAIGLLKMYNCKALVEATRVSVVTYFKEHKVPNLLLRKPKSAESNIDSRRRSNQIGCPATEKIITHGLDLIEAFINDYYFNIPFIDMLNETLHYSYVNKRKFDIIAAMGMCEMADEDMNGRVARVSEEYVNTKKGGKLGYYKDKYGVQRYGFFID